MLKLDFARRLQIGFAQATAVVDLEPCGTFANSIPIDAKYADVPKTKGFPNPWHIGTMGKGTYPPGTELIQGELELLAFMFGLVVQLKPMLVFESGTNVGLMARALGAGCWTNGFGRVVTAETNLALVDYAKKLCEDWPVTVVHGEALSCHELRSADLVFIDSGYESRSVEHSLIKPGAVFVYHDSYAEPWVRGEIAAEPFKVHIDTPRGFSIVRKP